MGWSDLEMLSPHDYEKINYDLVYRILHQDIEDIRKFIEIVAKI